ncbi:hypothetical protein W97_01456 [Coniosporium apollinis CBS 100218]|uniref:Glycosyltransferase family 34 protein n=1 Tax=Coniosporium apollinis (strain CBS 100218) TaxID=1168221 RepID=R7YK08_CONA1|nr:uncharacterized protein W97_01456 [Coniosporium apollinis CBS 100218]EON62235.1 hypothetical protein W97_01456 [Coniosporium apollinis CBS 100218]
MLYGQPNELYELALKTHERHSKQHGYEMHVLRRGITGGYWNKLAFLLKLVIQELEKPESERTDWIMYTDASTLLLNHLLPLHIFLPPSSPEFAHIHFLSSRSPTGTLNADVFFLHIDPWTVKFLIRAMAVPMIDQQVQLGHAMDATAMALVLNETEFRGAAMYQPAGWYHGVQTREGFSGHAGDLLVSLPAELMGERWRFLREWVERLGREGGRYGVSLRETNYPALIATFWERVRRARGVLRDAEEFAERERGDVNEELKRAIGRLKDAIVWMPESEDVLGEAEEACRRGMKAPPTMR